MDFDSFVLAAATNSLEDEPVARDHADAVEFRMDLAEDPLAQLAEYDGELPIIATNRIGEEGGEVPAGAQRRATLRQAASHAAVEAVDIELGSLADGTAAPVAAAAEEAGCTVIASAHDFDGTPSREAMAETLAMAAKNGDVGKLAVTATDRADALSLLSVTHERLLEGDRVATMAMGEPGRHTRAVAPLYGSRIGYAPVDPEEATAPGQYDLATLASLVSALEGPSGGRKFNS